MFLHGLVHACFVYPVCRSLKGVDTRKERMQGSGEGLTVCYLIVRGVGSVVAAALHVRVGAVGWGEGVGRRWGMVGRGWVGCSGVMGSVRRDGAAGEVMKEEVGGVG